MTKIIYIGSALLLGLLAFWHYLGNYFIDETSLKTSFVHQLPVLVGITLVLGSAYFFLFKKIFPMGWQQQTAVGKVAVALVFYILAFAVARHCAISLNILLPYRQKVFFEGIIDKKVVETTSKGTKFYQLKILSLVNDSVRTLDVSRKIFEQQEMGDTLRKFMYQGPFEIKYMEK